MKTVEFIQNIQENDELLAQMQSFESTEETYSFAQANGVTDSFEEFASVLQEMSVATSNMSNEEIDAICGGVGGYSGGSGGCGYSGGSGGCGYSGGS